MRLAALLSHLTILVILVILVIASCLPSDAEGFAQAETQGTGTVYFYFTGVDMPGVIKMGTPSIEIYFDQRLVAKLKKDRFLALKVEPGRHTFATKGLRTSTRETEINLDVGSGQDFFIRIDVVVGTFKWAGYLKVAEQEEGRLAVSKLKPVEASSVRDSSRVVTVPPEPQRRIAVDTPATPALRNEDILALKKAGFGDEVLLRKINESPGSYDLTESGLAALRNAGISDTLIAAMREARNQKR